MTALNKKILTIENGVIGATFLLIILTCFFLLANYMVKSRQKDVKILEPGTQFSFFKERLKDVKEIGFLTNKDMSEEKNDGTFLQAQYMLAPTVLTVNDKQQQLFILDYTKPVYAVFTLRSLRAAPLLSSPYGQILAERQP